MACPRCGFGENPAEARFCENCGGGLGVGGGPTAAEPASDLPPIEPSAADPVAPTSAAAADDTGDPFDAPTRELPSTVASGWICACGQPNPEGEQYCEGCGDARPVAAPSLGAGTVVAGFRITSAVSSKRYVVVPDGATGETPSSLLQLGDAEELAELAAVLGPLNAADLTERLGYTPAPAVVAVGSDPTYGDYLVLSSQARDRQPLAQMRDLPPTYAFALLRQLTAVADAEAQSGRVLLLAPPQVQLDGERLFLEQPVAPRLPLAGPLLADPAFLPPELRDRARDAVPWPAGVYAAAATVRAATGNALGYPRAWHELMVHLLAEDPACRPASLEDFCAALRAAETPVAVSSHATGFGTDIGHHHPVNQDAGGAWSWTPLDGAPLTLAVVADGVSAGEHSEQAAALTVELMHRAIEAHHADAGLNADALYTYLHEAGLEAQRRVADMPFSSYERANASTLVAVCLLGGHAVGMWCGDSRAYGVTPAGCRQLTRDHSWVNLVVDSGRMSLEQAKRDPRAHVIARWLGVADPPRTDPGFERFDVDLAPDDRLLVCSDGLYMYFDQPYAEEREIASVAFEHAADAQAAVDELIKRALDRGGFDNITAVLVAVE